MLSINGTTVESVAANMRDTSLLQLRMDNTTAGGDMGGGTAGLLGFSQKMTMMTGDGPRCTAVTKKGTRCRNASTNFGDSKLCYIHSRQAMGQSEMADIRGYRAENPASGPGMYRDAQNQWVVDDSIRLEAGLDPGDAIEL